MYLTPDPTKCWVIDIETESLEANHVWCMVAKNLGDGTCHRYTPGSDLLWLRSLSEDPEIRWVGHNAISFDIPILNRHFNLGIPLSRVVDTLVLSYLYNPHLEGGHALADWGQRLGLPKDEFGIFDHYSPELLARCERDVDINIELYKQLSAKMKGIGFSEWSCQIEHRTRAIIDVQQMAGCGFDTQRAIRFRGDLEQNQANLSKQVYELFPRSLAEVARYPIRHRKDGSRFSSYQRHVKKFPKVEDAPDGATYRCYDWTEFDLASPKQRVQKLLGLGWVPETFTPKGNPKVDEDALVAFSEALGKPEIKAIADWMVITSRLGMVNDWLKRVDANGRVHGEVWSCGAQSRRMRHQHPNCANIPSNDAKYGKECRSLWVPSPGRVLLGYDAKSIQLRLLCHYADNPETTRLLLETPDPHQANADGAAVTRRQAKNCFYALIFGARDPKLASLCGSNDATVGTRVRKVIYDKTPGLEKAIREAEAEYYSRIDHRLRCLDGGYVVCPGASAALNYLIQPAEAVIMKLAAIYLDDEIREHGYDAFKVLDVHDEAQFDCSPECADKVGAAACTALTRAGIDLGVRVRIDGSYKVGVNWSETH